MVISRKLCIWNNRRGFLINIILIMFFVFRKPFTVSSKPQDLGFNVSEHFPLITVFIASKRHLLFIFSKDNMLIYLLVYVDDIVLTCNDKRFIQAFIPQLHSEFAIKNLGALSYLLGLEVSHTSLGLFLSQVKYAYDILSRAVILDTKPVSTPLTTSDAFIT